MSDEKENEEMVIDEKDFEEEEELEANLEDLEEDKCIDEKEECLEGYMDDLDYDFEPISRRPIITEEEQKKMIFDFLKDDFMDI